MRLASRVERRPARRTARLAFKILADGQFSATSTAQYGLLLELRARPDLGAMVSFGLVTVKTRIVGLAALEFNGHDIDGTTVVDAARAPVQRDASYRNA